MRTKARNHLLPAALAAALVLSACTGTRQAVDEALPDATPADDLSGIAELQGQDLPTQDTTARPDVQPADATYDVRTPFDNASEDIVEPQDAPDAMDAVEPLSQCPETFPEAGTACVGDLHCLYGQECCCGECYDSMICDCMNSNFGCMYTDACLGGGWCNVPPCCNLAAADPCASMGDDYYCVTEAGGDYGKCMPAVTAPDCWTDGDCMKDETCHGPMLCPCDADCDGLDLPGICIPENLPTSCCFTDVECEKDPDVVWTCAFTQGIPYGRCMGPPGDGACWDDGDCANGENCQGAFFCPCDAPCGAPDVPGQCTAPGDVGDACGPDGGPCKQGLVCCYPCGVPPPGCQFVCMEPCEESEWCADGCPMVP